MDVPEGASGVAPDDILGTLRDALAHEGRLAALLAELGADLDTEEFLEVLEDVVERVGAQAPTQPASQFTETEARELEGAGVDLDRRPPAGAPPAARSAALYAHLLASALSTREAADLLGVEESRIRQRLGERTLFGVKAGRSWRVARFQFTEEGLVPGIDRVVVRLPEDVRLVALFRWLTTRNPDLVVEGEPVAPIDWLRAGQDPEEVAELAAEL